MKHASSYAKLFNSLISLAVQRLYKYPDHGFAAFDFTGKGYVTSEDFMNHAVVYKLPLTRIELSNHLKNNVFVEGSLPSKGKLGKKDKTRLDYDAFSK